MKSQAAKKRLAEERAKEELSHKALVPVTCACPFCGELIQTHLFFHQFGPMDSRVSVDTFDTSVGEDHPNWQHILTQVGDEWGWIIDVHTCSSKAIVSSQKKLDECKRKHLSQIEVELEVSA